MVKRLGLISVLGSMCLLLCGATEIDFSRIGKIERSNNTGVGAHEVAVEIKVSGWEFVNDSKTPAFVEWETRSLTRKGLKVVVERKEAPAFTLGVSARAEPTGGEGSEEVYAMAASSKEIGAMAYSLKPVDPVSIGESSNATEFYENGSRLAAYWNFAKKGAKPDPETWGKNAYETYRFSNSEYGEYTIYGRLDQAEPSTSIKNIQVKSIKYSDITSTATNSDDAPHVYVGESETKLALSAQPEPGDAFPATKPVWQSGAASHLANPERRAETYSFDRSEFGAKEAGCGYMSHDTRRLKLNVCLLGLAIDSNNNGYIDPDDEDVEDDSPGKILAINDGDRTGNGIPDYADGYDSPCGGISAANQSAQFTELEITVPKYLWSHRERLYFKLTYSESDPASVAADGTLPEGGFLRVWTADGDSARLKAPVNSGTQGNYVPAGSAIGFDKFFPDPPDSSFYPLMTRRLYVEAVKGGSDTVKVELWAENQDAAVTSDSVKVSAFKLELSIDSDNNNGCELPDKSPAENKLKNKSGEPGKIIRVNTGDSNLNGIPNWADGIAMNGNTTADASQKFIPIVLSLPDFPQLDYAADSVEFSYSAADPVNVQKIVNNRSSADYVYPAVTSYTLNSTAYARIWTVDGSVLRNPASVAATSGAGNFVPSGTQMSLSSLGFSSSVKEKTFYIEIVRTSSTVGDISVGATLRFNSGSVALSDQVKATGAVVDFSASPDQKYGFDNTPEGVVDLRSLVQARDLNPADHNGDNFPQPPIRVNPSVAAKQLSVAYESTAKHGNVTKVNVTVHPSGLSPDLFDFVSTSANVGVSTKATSGELTVTGNGRYETPDNKAISAVLQTDSSGDQQKFANLTVYSFKESVLAYDYFWMEDTASTHASKCQVSRKASATVSGGVSGSSAVSVNSAANFEIGDYLVTEVTASPKTVTRLGIISNIAGNTITLDRSVSIAANTIVYTIAIAPEDLTVSGRIPDSILRNAVAKFSLGTIAFGDTHYDLDNDGRLDTSNDLEEKELFKLFGTVPLKVGGGGDKHIYRIRSMSGNITGYAYPDGPIVLSDNGNLYTATHEGLHTKGLWHHRDQVNNVMWWTFGTKPLLHNTQYRSALNDNICETTNILNFQRVQRAWTEMSR